MWQYLFLFLAVISVSTLPPAPEYEECKKDDLYKSLKDHGANFCTRLLDPECYASITTPVEYATIDGSRLSFYVSAEENIRGDAWETSFTKYFAWK